MRSPWEGVGRVLRLLAALAMLPAAAPGQVLLTWSGATGAAQAPARDQDDTAPEAKNGGREDADEAFEEEEFVDEYASATLDVWDPFEPVNRTMFKFNHSVYDHVLRPFARGYETVLPAPARDGIRNFFDNLHYPVRLASNLLQGRFDRVAAETGKFALNSTVGLAGFIKVSDRYATLRVPDEDIGQAFGRWGLGHGPFLVLPILGPSSLRDGIGRIGDYYATPTHWNYLDHYDDWVEITLQVGDAVSSLPGLLDTYDSLRRAAVDPYIAFRNSYVQYREGQVKQ